MNGYGDIIDLPRHESKTHPRMSLRNRAAQFAPFAALTGYGDVIDEASRDAETRGLPGADEISELNERLMILEAAQDARPEVTIKYFERYPGRRGGEYIEETVKVRRVRAAERMLEFEDGRELPFHSIAALDGEVFDKGY